MVKILFSSGYFAAKVLMMVAANDSGDYAYEANEIR